jgi:putative NIF3 family GTP cyclohydrolase 1 type 2
MTAKDVLDLIKKNLGSPWNESTYRDVFHAGDPNVEVKGIATSFMATLDMIQRAHAAGLNMVVTHETTFWNDRDDTKDLTNDAVYRFKSDFCNKNKMVVLRLHDHAHSHRPDFIMTGLLRALGWTAPANAQPGPRVYTFPTTTLGELAASIQRRTKSKALRVIGDPKAKVSSGTAGMGYSTGRFSPNVDVVINGENPEAGNAYDPTEYALDAAFLGINKGQIILGHAISEEPGMEDVAEWLRTFIKDVPVKFVPSGEPYWSPAPRG